ncbi:ABC transporter permease [Egicoccus halophilus]|uniref:Transport permease protein n=1 Tax=Egicoccus halophilus TaxID=1670830 RepID=A0A8J3A9K6_9ACTN|nr:ABC transporter permease [Egicoccus halophilus]GGI07650.1 transport permease protein [Egicoccus halophilus]
MTRPAPEAGTVDRRTPLARAVLAQAAMELRLLLRSGESLLVTLGIPLGILGFFSVVEVLPTGDVPAVEFLVPGALAISVAATGLVAVAIQTAFERKYGVLKRLGGTPLPRWGFLVAKGLAVACVLAVQAVLVVALAVGALGWSPQGGALLAPVAVLVGAITFTALGLLMAGTLRAEATLALSNALFLVLLVVSGVAFDADALPATLAAIGRALPVGALGEVLRAAFAGEGLAGGALAVVAGWGAVAVALAARRFRWEP